MIFLIEGMRVHEFERVNPYLFGLDGDILYLLQRILPLKKTLMVKLFFP